MGWSAAVQVLDDAGGDKGKGKGKGDDEKGEKGKGKGKAKPRNPHNFGTYKII